MLNALEHLADGLAKQVEDYTARLKAQDVRLKAIKAEVEGAERLAAVRIAEVRSQADASIAAIQAEVAPYKDLVVQVKAQQLELAKVKQAMLDETASLQHARQMELARLDAVTASKSARLAKLTEEEDAFRKRLALI